MFIFFNEKKFNFFVIFLVTHKNDNFIDNTFSPVVDTLVQVLPATKIEKQSFLYYRAGMTAQSNGNYAEALENYYEALKIEEDPYDRSYILYNIGLIYANNGEHVKALDSYVECIQLNTELPQVFNNIAVLYYCHATKCKEQKLFELANLFFDNAAFYWKKAFKLAPNNYLEAQNWVAAYELLKSL